jgi:hypothetical protein
MLLMMMYVMRSIMMMYVMRYYMNVYECLNVIDDDVYDATHCENVNLMNV